MSTNAVSAAPVESVLISEIRIGARRRQKLGKLSGLQQSIGALGLVHPILIRDGGELVAGHRRLEACRALGWKKIPARRVDRMSDEDLRAIELDENSERLPLLDYETSKRRLAEIRQLEAVRQIEADANNGEKPSRKGPGRPSESGSRRSVAAAAGVSKDTVRNLESHVEIAEKFPFMQAWPQYHVLEAGELMEKLPKKEHAGVAVLLDQPGVPSKAAVKILTNLTENVPAEERLKLYEGAKSEDPDRRSSALSVAVAHPAMPEPALLISHEAVHQARLLVRRLAKIGDPLAAKAESAARLLEEIVTALTGRKVAP